MGVINESTGSVLKSLTRNAVEYLDTRWEMLQLNFTERGMSVGITLVSGLLITFFGGIILVFVSIGTAIWIGQLLENPAVGFFIMAAVLSIVLIAILIFARHYIRNYITDLILDSIKENDDEEAS